MAVKLGQLREIVSLLSWYWEGGWCRNLRGDPFSRCFSVVIFVMTKMIVDCTLPEDTDLPLQVIVKLRGVLKILMVGG